MTKSIIIGGGGFIGRQVAGLLSLLGREVHVLGRLSVPAHPLTAGVTYHAGDYGDRNCLRTLLKPGCEVINLAHSTVPKTSYDDPLHDLLSNLPANVALLEECASCDVGKLVIVSSGGTVYGPSGTPTLDEGSPTMPVSPYGISKLATEFYARMFHRNNDLPAVVVRPANAYGESQLSGRGQGFIAEAVDAILQGREILIYGERGTVRDYIHVSDVASGIVAALEHGRCGCVYNVSTGNGTSNLDVLELLRPIAGAAGREVRHRIAEPRVFDVERNVLDNSRLRKASGWCPQVALGEGIRRVWESKLRMADR
jgi:UDP-glucose 4-epimerase